MAETYAAAAQQVAEFERNIDVFFESMQLPAEEYFEAVWHFLRKR